MWWVAGLILGKIIKPILHTISTPGQPESQIRKYWVKLFREEGIDFWKTQWYSSVLPTAVAEPGPSRDTLDGRTKGHTTGSQGHTLEGRSQGYTTETPTADTNLHDCSVNRRNIYDLHSHCQGLVNPVFPQVLQCQSACDQFRQNFQTF